ncbi:hypothetical protein [Nocardioides sp. SYSU D00038]|uniref:hypothetical protein n=1 Tax=Nocardioides sp. SYSU D00038 TaxID=2812554 RepID=UPI00196841AF|nr:hypothetical protein [Nocardioides sp. SYSU D00038]
MTQDGDLGPKPEAEIEPGEPNPGGADAVPDDDGPAPLPADLAPEDNPAIDEEERPDALSEGEDTETEATKDGEGLDPEDESPV